MWEGALTMRLVGIRLGAAGSRPRCVIGGRCEVVCVACFDLADIVDLRHSGAPATHYLIEWSMRAVWHWELASSVES